MFPLNRFIENKLSTLASYHVPLFLSVHTPLGLPYEPATLKPPVTAYGFS